MILKREFYLQPALGVARALLGKIIVRQLDDAGHAYVYYMFNIVTEREGYPSAVLVRALQSLSEIETLKRNRGVNSERQLANGPAKLCKALNINKDLNTLDLCLGEK